MANLRLPPHVEGGSVFDTNLAAPAAFVSADHGYSAWSFDPAMAQGGVAHSAGLLYAIKIPVRATLVVTNVTLFVLTAGATLTSGGCFAGLYNQAGSLLSSTANQSTNWQSTGTKVMALTAPQTVPPGFCYVGFFSTGTTQPQFLRASTNSAVSANAGLASPNMRFVTASTALTTALPAAMTAQTASANAYWAAIS